MSDDPLKVDSSLWSPRDPKWKAKREKAWLEKEKLLCEFKKPRALQLIKSYFIRGTLPNWARHNKTWSINDGRRHVDLFTLLWLYPSSDYQELTVLRDAYLTAGYGRTPRDILAGYSNLEQFCAFIPSENGTITTTGKNNRQKTLKPRFDGDVELLARVMFESLSDASFDYEDKTYTLGTPGLGTLAGSGHWLNEKKMSEYGLKHMLQYDVALQTMRQIILANRVHVRARLNAPNSFPLTFSRFIQFDTEKEGETPRTTYTQMIRRSLNEDEWPDEIIELWNNVKCGEVIVENVWR